LIVESLSPEVRAKTLEAAKIALPAPKPITYHAAEGTEEKYIYSVLDGLSCYQYVLEENPDVITREEEPIDPT
jgi:hypothetical protein